MWAEYPWRTNTDWVHAQREELDVVDDIGPVDDIDAELDLTGDLAERLLRRFLGLCEHPRTRNTVLVLVKGSVGNAWAGRRLYALLNKTVLTPVAKTTGVHGSAMRVELVASQLVGLAMMRYVLEVEPVASADTERLVSMFAPALRATLTS